MKKNIKKENKKIERQILKGNLAVAALTVIMLAVISVIGLKKVQKEIVLSDSKIIEEIAEDEVAADLKDVDYVSSAGLRAMLIAYKTAESKKGSFILRNVQGAVREVLNMSGFSKFIQIED